MAYARSHTMTLLCAAKVRSCICVCGKEQLEVAEWCLVSPRQVRNWIRKDTNISVMNLYSLADEYSGAFSITSPAIGNLYSG